jgi:hypothetical protein|tara:strand:+ start:1476 stop:1841 length:366 start_codon:yes stop_codon:yes gene_type:complete
MGKAKDIRGLKSLLRKLEGDAETLKVSYINKQKEYGAKNDAVNDLKLKISRLESDNNIRVSEHAMLRYLERVKRIDISEVEKEILTDSVIDMVDKLGGNGTYPNNTFKVVMKNHTVITIIN